MNAKTFHGLRNKVLMLLMLGSGLRLTEALRLKLPEVNVPGSTVLAKVTRHALEVYLTARRRIVVASDLLFISRHGGELTSRHVQIMVSHRRFSPMDRLLSDV